MRQISQNFRSKSNLETKSSRIRKQLFYLFFLTSCCSCRWLCRRGGRNHRTEGELHRADLLLREEESVPSPGELASSQASWIRAAGSQARQLEPPGKKPAVSIRAEPERKKCRLLLIRHLCAESGSAADGSWRLPLPAPMAGCWPPAQVRGGHGCMQLRKEEAEEQGARRWRSRVRRS